ncbi:hypothetical protein V6N12_029642 [Hibiscus sabdariffa]|uniref:non-specific serine/threonine protein kinase n=1 Tax=Hibiscus sabdariffa TaxID=183260 RepID=A0ABR2CX89_9ROSI
MFLIYEYMARGSLLRVFANDVEAVELDWIKRVKIIKDTASALSYLHHDYHPPVVHRDISSNNILLNLDLEACISNFGTARLLDPDSSNQTMLVGTYGYVAPVTYLLMISKSTAITSEQSASCEGYYFRHNNRLCLLEVESEVLTDDEERVSRVSVSEKNRTRSSPNNLDLSDHRSFPLPQIVEIEQKSEDPHALNQFEGIL